MLKVFNKLSHKRAIAWGASMGDFIYYTGILRKGVVNNNVKTAFGDSITKDERKKIVHDFYRNIFMNVAEFARADKINKNFIDKYVKYDAGDLEKVDNALAKNKGLTILTGHVGNWEMLGIFFGTHGYQMHNIARAISGGVFNRLVIRQRMVSGNVIIDKRNALIKMVRVYKKNGIVGILLDQRASGKEGVEVEFFGKKAVTNKALGAVTRKMDIPVLPAFLMRDRENPMYHKIYIADEIEIQKTDDEEGDLKVNTQKFNDAIEKFIRAHPEQWFWFHSRWEKRDSWFKRYRSKKRRQKGYRSDKYGRADIGDYKDENK